MTDGEDRLAGVEERFGEGHHPPIGPKVVRRVATRNEQRIELLRARLVDAGLGLRGHLALLALQLLTGLEPDDRNLMALLFERIVGLLELRVLVVNIEYTGNPHSDTSLCMFPDIGGPAYWSPPLIVKLVLRGTIPYCEDAWFDELSLIWRPSAP